jgi:AcrR family transcriptional regulator
MADFSMLTLAGRAEVSPATPYNLFGSKPQLLSALFNRSLAALRGTAHYTSGL